MARVEFTKDNALMCICARCPVQDASSCSAEKSAKLMSAMETAEAAGEMPSPADVPGLYCASGVAACGDLDLALLCICGGCPVHADNGLGQLKYCGRGAAIEIG